MSRPPMEASTPFCPSAQPDMADARVFGVLSGTADEPRIAYLKPGVMVDPGALPADDRGVKVTEVFRFAARCEEHQCAHFDGSRCTLAKRIVASLPPVVETLPQCQIRPECRWYAEQGREACFRCPQVVTVVPKRDDALNRAATPPDRDAHAERLQGVEP
jgi:hypothetical protein